jgi:hypothetical protein
MTPAARPSRKDRQEYLGRGIKNAIALPILVESPAKTVSSMAKPKLISMTIPIGALIRQLR